MQAASEEMRFEDAAACRDLIQSIRRIGERQKITGYGQEERDIIAVSMDESLDLREQDAVVQVFFVRDGKLIGRDHFIFGWRGDKKEQVLSSFLKQFYAGTPFIPKEILLQKEIEDAALIEEWLRQKRTDGCTSQCRKKGQREAGRAGAGECAPGSGKKTGAHPPGRRAYHRRCPKVEGWLALGTCAHGGLGYFQHQRF